MHTPLYSLSFEFGSRGSRRLQVWGPALGQLDLRLLLVWFPSGGHRLKIQEIQEELRFRLESRGRKHAGLVQRQEEPSLFVGKFCLDLQLDWMRLLHWGRATSFPQATASKASLTKTPTPLTDTSRDECDQVTGHSITLIHRINITVCVLVCLCLKIPSPDLFY